MCKRVSPCGMVEKANEYIGRKIRRKKIERWNSINKNFIISKQKEKVVKNK